MSKYTHSDLQEWLSSGEIRQIGSSGYKMKDNSPRIVCADGGGLSVQASNTHYCSPRENIGPWHLVEVGFPSHEPPETWSEYFDGDWDNDDRTSSVYGYIPVGLVIEYINSHGGEK